MKYGVYSKLSSIILGFRKESSPKFKLVKLVTDGGQVLKPQEEETGTNSEEQIAQTMASPSTAPSTTSSTSTPPLVKKKVLLGEPPKTTTGGNDNDETTTPKKPQRVFIKTKDGRLLQLPNGEGLKIIAKSKATGANASSASSGAEDGGGGGGGSVRCDVEGGSSMSYSQVRNKVQPTTVATVFMGDKSSSNARSKKMVFSGSQKLPAYLQDQELPCSNLKKLDHYIKKGVGMNTDRKKAWVAKRSMFPTTANKSNLTAEK